MFNRVNFLPPPSFRYNPAKVKAEVAGSHSHLAGPGASNFSMGPTDGSQESGAVGITTHFTDDRTEA